MNKIEQHRQDIDYLFAILTTEQIYMNRHYKWMVFYTAGICVSAFMVISSFRFKIIDQALALILFIFCAFMFNNNRIRFNRHCENISNLGAKITVHMSAIKRLIDEKSN